MGNEPTGPEKLMLAELWMACSAGRQCEDLDELDNARTAKSRDRRSQLYFFRVPRARLSVAHDASTSANGAMILDFASDKRRAEVLASRYRMLVGRRAVSMDGQMVDICLASVYDVSGGDDTFCLSTKLSDTCSCTSAILVSCTLPYAGGAEDTKHQAIGGLI